MNNLLIFPIEKLDLLYYNNSVKLWANSVFSTIRTEKNNE